MRRQEFSRKVKIAAFRRTDGQCQSCTARLYPGKFRYDHKLPWELGGESTLDNCQVICLSCDGKKTYREDVPRIAKAKRQQARHLGAKRSSRPMFGSKASGWKHKMDGTWERRE